jgi:hypothetical protein
MKKIIIPTLILVFLLINIRHFFSYNEIRVIPTRQNSLTLKEDIKTNDIEDIVELALGITKDKLSFSPFSKNNLDVDYLDKSGKAHCWGYAAYYNAVLKRLLKSNNIHNVEIKHVRAKTHLFGFNLHQFFTHRGLIDHDISVITNKTTGEKIYVDPSLSEVFGNIII